MSIWRHISVTPSLANTAKVWVLADQAVASGGNFVVTLLLARWLGTVDFGFFALGWMLILCCSSLQQALIIAPMYSLYPKAEDGKQFLKQLHTFQWMATILIMMLGWAIAMVVWATNLFSMPSYFKWMLPLLGGGFIVNDFYRRAYFAVKQPKSTLALDLFVFGSQIMLIIGLFTTGLMQLRFIFMGFIVIYVLTIGFHITHWGWETRWKELKSGIFAIWSYARFLVGTAALQWFSGNFFIITAGALLTPAAIGVVRIGQNVMGVLNVLFLGLENMVPLQAAEILNTHGMAKTRAYFRNIFIKGGALTLGVLGLISYARVPIIQLLYGPEYVGYAYVLVGFSCVYLGVYTTTILSFVLRTFELNKVFFFTYILTSGFSILAASYYVEWWGIKGVLLGLGSVQVINVLVYASYVQLKLFRK